MPSDILLPAGDQVVPVVLMLSGHDGFKNWGFFPHVARRFRDAGFAVVNFNFSMCGVRDGEDVFADLDLYERNSPTQEIADTEVMLQHVLARDLPGGNRFDVSRIGLYSHSLGGGVALIVAARHKRVGFSVLWSSIATLKVWPESEMQKWRKNGYLENKNNRTNQVLRMGKNFLRDVDEADSRFNILDAAAKVTSPFVVVHGEKDESVPVAHASQICDAARTGIAALHVVPGGTHTFGTAHPFAQTSPELEEAVARSVLWMREVVRK